MRGEQKPADDALGVAVGSPPLARGTDRELPAAIAETRITPACAGNSFPLCSRLLFGGDHPRLRGEQLFKRLHT